MHQIFVDGAIDDPQGLNIAQDGRTTADVDARGCAKCATDGLKIQTCHATFEHFAHICHTF